MPANSAKKRNQTEQYKKKLNLAIDLLFQKLETSVGLRFLEQAVAQLSESHTETKRYPFVDEFLSKNHDLPSRMHALVQIVIFIVKMLIKEIFRLQRKNQRVHRLQSFKNKKKKKGSLPNTFSVWPLWH